MQYIDKLYSSSPNINMIRIFAITVMINVMIFTFLVSTFSRVKNEIGIVGPKGSRGDTGLEGTSSKCAICSKTNKNTVGYNARKEREAMFTYPMKPLIK